MNYDKLIKEIAKELRFAIQGSGLKQSDIKMNGLSYSSLSKKLNNPNEFRLSELIALCRLFKLDLKEITSRC